MADSILDSVKKVVGLEADYNAFDSDILMHINSVFSTLTQIGVGPSDGFSIEDNAPTWEDYLGTDKRLAHVKNYVFLRVRLLFDPPAMSFHINALQEQYRELEWRLNVQREMTEWVDPTSGAGLEDDEITVLDAGNA